MQTYDLWVPDAWLLAGVLGAYTFGIVALERRDQQRKDRNRLEQSSDSGESAGRSHKIVWYSKINQVIKFDRVIGVLTLGFVAGYTFLTYQSLEITRESYTAVQRAFVAVSGFEYQNLYVDAEDSRSFVPIIRNSGNTPAINVEYTAGGLVYLNQTEKPFPGVPMPEPGDPDLQYLMMKAGEEKFGPALNTAISRTIIGPQTSMPVMPGGISISNSWLNHPNNKGSSIYFMGVIRYRDVFSKSAAHITKFCFRMLGYQDGPGGPKARYVYCKHWNCADEQCKDDYREFLNDSISALKIAGKPIPPSWRMTAIGMQPEPLPLPPTAQAPKKSPKDDGKDH